jgi:hypothetical protein
LIRLTTARDWLRYVSDMIAPVVAVIAERYAGLLGACDDLREYAISMVDPWGGRVVENDAKHDQLLLSVNSRSLNTFWSSTNLARIGFGAQAAMLNRSLFEDMIDAHWITVEPDLAVERFEDHHLHGRMLLAYAALAQGVVEADKIPEFDPAERKRLDGIFGKHGDSSWTGIGTYKRVMAVEHLWEPEGRETLHFYRRLVHRESNQLLHLSAFSIDAQFRGRTEDALSLALGPSDHYVEKALIAALYAYGQLLSVVRDTFGFTDDDRWQAVSDKPIDELRPADR